MSTNIKEVPTYEAVATFQAEGDPHIKEKEIEVDSDEEEVNGNFLKATLTALRSLVTETKDDSFKAMLDKIEATYSFTWKDLELYLQELGDNKAFLLIDRLGIDLEESAREIENFVKSEEPMKKALEDSSRICEILSSGSASGPCEISRYYVWTKDIANLAKRSNPTSSQFYIRSIKDCKPSHVAAVWLGECESQSKLHEARGYSHVLSLDALRTKLQEATQQGESKC